MDPVQKSEYYYANRVAWITIKALEEVVGKSQMSAVLMAAHLPHLINHYPPSDLDRRFNFADFSAFNQALEEVFGVRGGRGLALRVGRAAFSDLLRNFGSLAGTGDLTFRMLPSQAKVSAGLRAMAKIFNQISDQRVTVEEHDRDFVYTIQQCPVCWGRSAADEPVCFIMVGLLQEGLKWFSGGNEYLVDENRCIAMGDDACEFVIQKASIN